MGDGTDELSSSPLEAMVAGADPDRSKIRQNEGLADRQSGFDNQKLLLKPMRFPQNVG
jgi:hypothetical protein